MSFHVDGVSLHIHAKPEIQHVTTLHGGYCEGTVIMNITLRRLSAADSEVLLDDGLLRLFGTPANLRAFTASIETALVVAEGKVAAR